MRCLLPALLTLSSAMVASAAPAEPVFRFVRDVEVSDITAVTPVAVPLDSHFFAETRENWPDVRLRTATGAAVGFVIRPATDVQSTTIRRTWTASQTGAKVDPERGLLVELQFGDKDPTPSGLRIITPLRDFEHQVRVETSADGETWIAAGEPTLIFDYSRYVAARNDVVPITPGDHRHVRFQIEDITAEQESLLLELHQRLRGGTETERTERTSITRRPFRIDKVEFLVDELRPSGTEPRTTLYAAQDFNITQDDKEHRTVITLETQREPITGLTLVTGSENFSRTATVLAEELAADGKSHWRQLAAGAVTRFAVGKVERTELQLTIPESRRRKYLITIENRDSPALEITGIEPTGPVYELAYLAAPGQQFQLDYGSDTAAAGEYDIAALEAALNQGPLTAKGSLSPPTVNPNAPAAQSSVSQPWNDPRVQIGLIVSLTLLLGWGLFRASRQLPPPTEL